MSLVEAARRRVLRLSESFGVRNRTRKGEIVRAFATAQGVKRVLFVGSSGAWGPRGHLVERAALLPDHRFVAACDLDPRIDMPWPYVCADGRRLPFRAAAFDLVLSNAVVEHVGNIGDQRAFVAEHRRVGLSWVVTTPNRWFPVESHTGAVLLHWWRPWRARQEAFTRLLSRREFHALLPAGATLHGRPWSATFVGAGKSTGAPEARS